MILLVLVFLFTPLVGVFAQGQQFPGDVDPVISGSTNPPGIVPCGDVASGEQRCNACHLVALAQDIINFGVYLVVFVATLAIVWAGFLYITAGGNPGKVEAAHKIFATVITGLIIVLGAWLLVDLLLGTFLNDDPREFGPWNSIICVSTS